MTKETFDHLIELVGSVMQKQDRNFRTGITPEDK
jgi:hypothetical protein